jgi:hypothetical protein
MESRKAVELLAFLALLKGGTVEVSHILQTAREGIADGKRPMARWRQIS